MRSFNDFLRFVFPDWLRCRWRSRAKEPPPYHLQFGYRLRSMTADDLAAVVAIEAHTTARPWSREEFETRLERSNVSGFVITLEERILGFACCRFNDETITILRLAVSPRWMRRQVGSSLLRSILRIAQNSQRVAEMELPEQATAGRALLRRHGFLVKPPLGAGIAYGVTTHVVYSFIWVPPNITGAAPEKRNIPSPPERRINEETPSFPKNPHSPNRAWRQ